MTCCTETHIALQEGQSGILVFTLKDENEDLVATAALLSLTLHLYHRSPVTALITEGLLINNRDEQSVLNEHGGEYFDTLQTLEDGTTYNFKWAFTPEDVPFHLSDRFTEELHVALFRATWDSGTKAFAHQIVMTVCNLKQFPVELPS